MSDEGGRPLMSRSARAIADVLAGARTYDTLDDHDQAVVRASWDERMATQIAALDLAAEFEAAGEAYSELDGAGNVVTHQPA